MDFIASENLYIGTVDSFVLQKNIGEYKTTSGDVMMLRIKLDGSGWKYSTEKGKPINMQELVYDGFETSNSEVLGLVAHNAKENVFGEKWGDIIPKNNSPVVLAMTEIPNMDHVEFRNTKKIGDVFITMEVFIQDRWIGRAIIMRKVSEHGKRYVIVYGAMHDGNVTVTGFAGF